MGEAFERLGRDGWRPDGDLVELAGTLRRAAIAADLPPAALNGSACVPGLHPGFMTTAEAARKRGVTAHRIAQMASQGAFPGARRLGHMWLIPAAEVEER